MNKKLTLDEMKLLLIDYNENSNEEAITSLIKYNSKLVTYFVKKYLKCGMTFEELFSAGMEGLYKALIRFDYRNNPMEAFSTYLGLYIEGSIKSELKKYNKHSHVISFEQPIGSNKNGDEMKIEDIIGTDADELIENVISDMKIGIVKDALNCLTTKEKQIIFLRYGISEAYQKTQEELAQMLGCSQSQIARIEQKALVKMRHPRNTKKLKDFIDE